MKRSIARLLVAVAAFVAPACQASQDSPMVTLVDEGSYEDVWQQYLGTAHPADHGGLVAEGDLYFASEDDLRGYFDQRMLEDTDKAHAFQRVSDGYVPKYSFPAQRNIRYCVSNAFAPDKATWVSRVAEAARAWERVANIRFVYLSAFDSACTSAQTGVDFAVVRANLGGYIACNKLLWSGLAPECADGFGALRINPNFDVTYSGLYPNLTPTGVLRHELGHILSLRHEHPWRGSLSFGCFETPDFAVYDLTGLQLSAVAYDQASVMHYPFAACEGQAQTAFTLTMTDVFSVQKLYGMHPAWVGTVNSVALL